MYVRLSCFIVLMAILCGVGFIQAATIEHFSDETGGSQSFSENGSTFTITGSYLKITQKSEWGLDDDFYVDNLSDMMSSDGVVGSFVCTSSDFYINNLWIIQLNENKLVSGSNDLLIRGKLDGSTQFTHTVNYYEFNSGTANNYFTYVDLLSYSSILIDEIEFETQDYETYLIRALMIDDFRFTPVAAVTFTDGSGFTPSITKGSAFQPLTDATFNPGSDSQIGLTVAADPGDGNSVTYNSFSSSISTSGTYYFLTADVDAGATGALQGMIVTNANLTISNGSLTGNINNAPLSNSDVSLPVSLASFIASMQGKTIVLNWLTASETDNLGFTLERSEDEKVSWQVIASYKTDKTLESYGNTTDQSEYTFTDNTIEAGQSYYYRLSDENIKGELTSHPTIFVQSVALPVETRLEMAYPNPFNPQTYITYHLAEDTPVTITVYDMLGRSVKTLVNGRRSAGSYHVYWNGMNENGKQASSGSYMIRMQTDKETQIQKVTLLK